MINSNKLLNYTIVLTSCIIFIFAIAYFNTLSKLEESRATLDSLLKPTPFLVERLNEHDVLLTNNEDTIHLYFENSYELNEEVIFVKFKK
jgi:hypothetical protein